MPVQSRSQVAFGVVEVNKLQFIESNQGIEFFQCAPDAFRCPELVSGPEKMAGVQADADTLGIQGIDYSRDVSKRHPYLLFLVPAVFSRRRITSFSIPENAEDIASTSLLSIPSLDQSHGDCPGGSPGMVFGADHI